MIMTVKEKGGVFKQLMQQAQPIMTTPCHDLVESVCDQDFESWYRLWKDSGKVFIDKRFQQISNTPLVK